MVDKANDNEKNTITKINHQRKEHGSISESSSKKIYQNAEPNQSAAGMDGV
jgi:hypothetical protein